MNETHENLTLDPSFHLRRQDCFGVHVNPGTIDNYVDHVQNLVKYRQKWQIFYINVHSLYLCLKDASICRLFRDASLMVDGMPIIALLRLIGAQATRQERVTWVDFIWPLLQRAQIRGWRVFWVGNTPEAMRNGLAVVRSRYPTLTIDGVDGYFDTTAGSEDNRGVIERMNDFGTDVCIVGMGTPRQESWVKENRSLIDAPVVLTAGACLEYVSGAVATPPRWMGRWGLEWSYRLFENPGRFARRYLVEPWALLGMLLLQSLGLRRSGCENSLPREIGSES